jgi:hypothetical protein
VARRDPPRQPVRGQKSNSAPLTPRHDARFAAARAPREGQRGALTSEQAAHQRQAESVAAAPAEAGVADPQARALPFDLDAAAGLRMRERVGQQARQHRLQQHLGQLDLVAAPQPDVDAQASPPTLRRWSWRPSTPSNSFRRGCRCAGSRPPRGGTAAQREPEGRRRSSRGQ